MLSEPKSAPKDEFMEHFERNYKQRAESHLKWMHQQSLATKILFAFLICWIVITTTLSGLSQVFSLISPTLLPFVTAVPIFLALAAWVSTLIISGVKMESLKVREKDVLTYFLLRAADNYHAFVTEKGEQEFLDNCISNMSCFSKTLEKLLANADMPLNLPNLSQLTAFSENIKQLVIPALRQRKEYPATPQERDFSEVFVSLAKLFFYEKEYEELPKINDTIAEKLKDIQPEPEEEKGKRTTQLLGDNRVLLPASLLGVTVIVLLLVYLFRATGYEPSTYWSYVADKASELAVAIVGGWLALLVALVFSRKRAKA